MTESELIRELLSKYSTISGKSWFQQQGSKHFIGRGLLMANGDDWYHQRHIVAPAFMGDKLKVHIYICLDISFLSLDRGLGFKSRRFCKSWCLIFLPFKVRGLGFESCRFSNGLSLWGRVMQGTWWSARNRCWSRWGTRWRMGKRSLRSENT